MTYAQFKQNRGIIGSVVLRKITYAQFKQNRGIIGSVLRKMTYAQFKKNRGIMGIGTMPILLLLLPTILLTTYYLQN
jgi:hypothetical protein